MKLHVLSDLHLEFSDFHFTYVDADVTVLAGDVDLGVKGIQWAKQAFPNRPVIYVMGNHEFYGKVYPKEIDKLREAASGSNVHLLENDRFDLGDITFLGTTLWTDFDLFGNRHASGLVANESMTDFSKIRIAPHFSRLRPNDTVYAHLQSKSWLQSELDTLHDRKIVIVSHHAPTKRSVPEAYQADLISAAYASNLEELIKASKALFWFHGHVHEAVDELIGETRVICNPRGYPLEQNHGFLPGLVFEI